MILGKITGRTSTTEFKFSVDNEANKFEYVQVLDKAENYVLCQIIEIEKDHSKGIAYCNIIGYRDKADRLRGLRSPLEPGTEVLYADDKFVKKILGLGKSKNSAFIGNLEGRKKLHVFLDLNKLLTKHVAILAKTGAGKSYVAGVLLEELLENKIPIVIIDPHGEYSTLKNPNDSDNELENEDSSVKWTLINILEYVKKLDLFSNAPTPLFELVKPGKASIINLKGVNPDIQEVVVYKLVKDLFTERKKGNIPPFFLVVEEGHNFIPERSYGETKSSGVLRQIFSEGRKFGLGVCLVSQRPSRVEKNALSQVNTQIILKVTNPNDIKAIGRSVEGITSETEKEIKNIPIGTALVTGVVDMPIFVRVRPRRSKHGGAAIKIFDEEREEDKDFVTEAKKGNGEMLPLIKQKISLKDLKLMGKKNPKVVLVPCVVLSCSDKEGNFNLLINLNNGQVITDVESGKGIQLKDLKLDNLSPNQERVMKIALQLKEFKPADIFSKSGLQFSDLYDTIKSMANKGFFVKDGEKYSLSESLYTLVNIRENAFYGKVDYSAMKFDKQIEKKVDVISLVQFLGRFLSIKNERECWLVIYE